MLELLAVIAIIALVAAILLPSLSQARDRARSIICLNNTKQLFVAWHLYASDDAEMLPYNMELADLSTRTDLNWVNNVMTWDLSSDNTNPATITQASLGPLVSGNTAVYHCPSDNTLSAEQKAAGWTARLRSYSMNGMVGNAGPTSTNGYNLYNPDYVQFFKSTQITHPADIFVFLDEHPDSIDDGCFLNESPAYSDAMVADDDGPEWTHLPASYHDRSTAFAFADGHSSLHQWMEPTTILPPVPEAAKLPILIPENTVSGLADLDWVVRHMSVDKQ